MVDSLLETSLQVSDGAEVVENLEDQGASKNYLDGENGMASDASLAIRPDHIPEKFWDVKAGTARVEDLAKSYGALEKKMGSMISLPGENASDADRAAFLKALGVPEMASGYEIKTQEGMIESDDEVNEILHDAGFSNAQAQVVYDMARDKVIPMIEEAAAEFEAQRQNERLEQHFGSKIKWEETSRQLLGWGKTNLPENVLGALSTTYEGILTLHEMMKSGEPPFVREGRANGGGVAEAEIKSLMRDPKYWRDHDPVLMAKVTDGFKTLYAEKA